MSSPDEEDEEFQRALKLSLDLAQNDAPNEDEIPKAPGAAAFLERRQHLHSSSAHPSVAPSHKSSRPSESQEVPSTPDLSASPNALFASLPEAVHRKRRPPLDSILSIARAVPTVVDLDDEEEPKPKADEKPQQVSLTDDDLALAMSRMSEEQVDAYFSGTFPEHELKALLAQARSSHSSPAKHSDVKDFSMPIAIPEEVVGVGVESESQASADGGTDGGRGVGTVGVTPYTNPQRSFRLNWLSTMPRVTHSRPTSRDVVPEFLQLRDLICKDAKCVIFTTFRVQMSWLLMAVPALLIVPSFVYHGENGDIFANENLPGHGPGEERMWQFIRHAETKARGAGKSKLPEKPPFRAQRVHSDASRMWPGCPHGKLIIVQYPTCLRVCVSTANLYESDYLNKTQAIWFQDFPLQSITDAMAPNISSSSSSYSSSYSTNAHAPASSHEERQHHFNRSLDEATIKKVRAMARDFSQSLKDYFARLVRGFDTTIFDRYDFSNVRVSLITSVIGTVPMQLATQYGHTKLAEVLSKEASTPHGTPHKTPSIVYAQMSSLGTLSTNYMESLKASFSQSNQHDAVKPNLTLVWPSVEFVRRSIDGWLSGSSLCAGTRQITTKQFVMKSLLRYTPLQPERRDIPPHIKSYWRIYADGGVGWACITSANFSKSAWGELQKGSKLSMSNFEAGVLFLPSLLAIPATFGPDTELGDAKSVMLSAGARGSSSRTADGSTLHITLPIPFDIKSDPYPVNQNLASAADQPWTWDLPRHDLDRFGAPYAGHSS